MSDFRLDYLDKNAEIICAAVMGTDGRTFPQIFKAAQNLCKMNRYMDFVSVRITMLDQEGEGFPQTVNRPPSVALHRFTK